MYIYILQKFKDIHSKQIYEADTIIQVSASRYKEILKNTNELKKNKRLINDLVREATKEEINSLSANDSTIKEKENSSEKSISKIDEVKKENDRNDK